MFWVSVGSFGPLGVCLVCWVSWGPCIHVKDGEMSCECASAGVELRFEGSEELGYDPLGTPPRGEICLRGPIVFDGYYQDKKKTEEAFGERDL